GYSRMSIKILIVNDDVVSSDLYNYLVTEVFKATADIASDADSAEHLLRTRKYNAVILDHVLPGETGLSLLTRLREGEITRNEASTLANVPVLFVTADYYARRTLDEAKRLGATPVGLNVNGGQQEFYDQMRGFLAQVAH